MNKSAGMGALAAGVLLLGGGVLWALKPAEPAVPAAVQSPTTVSPLAGPAQGAGSPVASRSGLQFVTGTEQLPRSLQDTQVDGALQVDAAGRLIINKGVRNVFDYFLSAQGEEDRDTLVRRIRAYIRHQLTDPARQQAEQLLDQYLLYQQALKTLPAFAGNPMQDFEQVRAQLDRIRELRGRYFDRLTQQAFFGEEQDYDDYMLAKLQILANPQLSATAKAGQISQLTQRLSMPLQEDIRVLNQYQDLTALTETWKQQGGNPQELRRIREQVVGAAAADRLEALDQENVQWTHRVEAYLAQRDRLLQQPDRPEGNRQAIEQLRQQGFSKTEQLRLDALETLHDRGQGLS